MSAVLSHPDESGFPKDPKVARHPRLAHRRERAPQLARRSLPSGEEIEDLPSSLVRKRSEGVHGSGSRITQNVFMTRPLIQGSLAKFRSDGPRPRRIIYLYSYIMSIDKGRCG